MISATQGSRMKQAVCLLALLAATFPCRSLSKNSSAGPDLHRFSSDQLKACYKDKSVCGTDNVYEISDELQRRLPKLSTATLVACFDEWKICGVGNDLETGWAVSSEVARRGNPDKLLVRYWTESHEGIRDGIIHVAYRYNTPEVAAFMKKVLAAGKGDEDTLYWPADYLAKRCDSDALRWLSSRHGRPEGCLLWAPTVARFGKCLYRPAIPYLVENSLDDACLNIVGAAVDDLHAMYPHSPKSFDGIGNMRKYFCDRAKQEDLKVDCDAK